MSDQPISIPDLLAIEPLNLAWTVMHGEEVVTVPYAALLALVEAVETAERVLDEFEMVVPPAAAGLPGDAPWQRAQRGLRNALARFDFGPPVSSREPT